MRTYRGRTLEEILPQIREELGPDAIILREREGLVGGVGGFFAQRFIEVEARRGDGQSIDIYDDEGEDEDELLFGPTGRRARRRTGHSDRARARSPRALSSSRRTRRPACSASRFRGASRRPRTRSGEAGGPRSRPIGAAG